MKIENVIAGALFDLMGFLTSRDERLSLSAVDDASPVVKVLEQFAATRGFSLDDADVPNWRSALNQPGGALPARPEPHWKANGSFSAEQLDAHAREAWTMGLDAGMEYAPAADETTLPDLARLLGTASKEGKAVKLSPIAAGTLYNAMTTAPAPTAHDHAADMDLARRIGMLLATSTKVDPVTAGKLAVDIVQMLPRAAAPAVQSAEPASDALRAGNVTLDEALASGELQQLKSEAQALAADGSNWSMDVGCMFVLAMIERIEVGESAAARIAELEALLAKRHRANFILSQTIHNIMVGNQSAWIEWQTGAGAESAMEWIQNGLIGPGLIPQPDGKSAQEWYDANCDDRMEPTDPHQPGRAT